MPWPTESVAAALKEEAHDEATQQHCNSWGTWTKTKHQTEDDQWTAWQTDQDYDGWAEWAEWGQTVKEEAASVKAETESWTGTKAETGCAKPEDMEADHGVSELKAEPCRRGRKRKAPKVPLEERIGLSFQGLAPKDCVHRFFQRYCAGPVSENHYYRCGQSGSGFIAVLHTPSFFGLKHGLVCLQHCQDNKQLSAFRLPESPCRSLSERPRPRRQVCSRTIWRSLKLHAPHWRRQWGASASVQLQRFGDFRSPRTCFVCTLVDFRKSPNR